MQGPAGKSPLSSVQVLHRFPKLASTLDGYQSLTGDREEDIDMPSAPCPSRPRALPGLGPFSRRKEAAEERGLPGGAEG